MEGELREPVPQTAIGVAELRPPVPTMALVWPMPLRAKNRENYDLASAGVALLFAPAFGVVRQ